MSTTTRKPVTAVRALGWAVVTIGLTVSSATSIDAAAEHPLRDRPLADNGPEAIMADHDCGPHVTSNPRGVVVSIGGTPTYQHGPDAAATAYAGLLDGTGHYVYAFCAR